MAKTRALLQFCGYLVLTSRAVSRISANDALSFLEFAACFWMGPDGIRARERRSDFLGSSTARRQALSYFLSLVFDDFCWRIRTECTAQFRCGSPPQAAAHDDTVACC